MTTNNRVLVRALVRSTVVLACALVCASVQVPAAENDGEARTLVEAIKNGDVGLSLRYRWERVTDDNPAVADDEGNASTIRTVLSYRTAPFYGFSAFVAFEDVSNLGASNDHNDSKNGVTDHPAIIDPPGTDFEQGYLRYSLPDIVDVQAGRIELNLAQQRYVGAVGWRQNHQVFDAAQVNITVIPRTTLRITYIDNALRIFDDSQEMSSPLADAVMRIGKAGTLTAYYYKVDYDDFANSGLSTATGGLRWQNTWDLPGEWSIPYHVEYAQQSDTGENPADVDADYWRVEFAGKRKKLIVKAGYEFLGGSVNDGAFTTPLATLHKWNGWADKFLKTPPDGLTDLYFSAGYGWGGWSGTLVYHDFQSDSENIDYGSEIDAVVQWKSSWKQVFAGKVALYNADDFEFDTEKFWVYTSWKM